jgi:Protein of unknown function (DUF3037)
MPEHNNRDPEPAVENGPGAPAERTLVHRILRYVPNLLRDEWVNIGVLLYDPNTGERRLRLIEDTTEFNRVRRLHPRFDETALRALRDHLESRIGAAMQSSGNGGPILGAGRSALLNGEGNPKPDTTEWFSILEKWDATLSQTLQLADPKATVADDINTEIDRLYAERVAVISIAGQVRPSRPNSRVDMRRYCEQVLRQARIWDRIERLVPMKEFTFDSDRMKIDFGYRLNHKRGFVQTVPITRNTADARLFADAARAITDFSKNRFDAELTAVTDVALDRTHDPGNFFKDLFQDRGITPVPLDNFAVWTAKLRPMLQ